MSIIQEIMADDQILAVHIPSVSWAKGLNFYSKDDNFIQIGTWGYDAGKILQPHIHNEVKREVNRTQEVVYVKSGKLAAFIYSEEGKLIERIELCAGDVLIALKGGHGYEIMEDNTYVLEVKNGPYPGAEIDRRRIEW